MQLFTSPLRMRIVHALYGGRELTTAQIGARLKDVSPATTYRHVAALQQMGVLDVVGERRVRGTVERTYRLHPSAARLSLEDRAALTPADLLAALGTVSAVQLAEFEQTTSSGTPIAADRVLLAQLALWLTDEEAVALIRKIGTIIARQKSNAADGRRPYLFTPTLIPAVEDNRDGE